MVSLKLVNLNFKKKKTGDCVTRALMVALNLSYQETAKLQFETWMKTGFYTTDKKNYSKILEDAGFIKHSESPADTGKMQFCIGDNNIGGDLFEFGNTEGGAFTPTFTITSAGVATGSNGQLHSVSVLTGTISHGGTIPLPSGYSEGQCRWMVSMNNDNPSNTAWDWQEGVSSDHIHSYCSANGTRVVTCYRTVLNETGSQTHNGTANYIIIGVK